MDVSTDITTGLNQPLKSKNQLPSWYKVSIANTEHSIASGLNGLVDHAAPIFQSFSTIQQEILSTTNYKSLNQHLEQLHQHYQRLEHPQDITVAAHYILCATLDDILHSLNIQDGGFLNRFHNSRLEQEKFYSILEYVQSQPEKYIDLLELIYLCLRFGYKGQYRNTPFGLQKWINITDRVYRLISKTRGQHSQALSKLSWLETEFQETMIGMKKQKTKKSFKRFYVISVFALIGFILVSSFVFHSSYKKISDVLMTHEVSAI